MFVPLLVEGKATPGDLRRVRPDGDPEWSLDDVADMLEALAVTAENARRAAKAGDS